jgi:predicted Rossmann fold flavoprotein
MKADDAVTQFAVIGGGAAGFFAAIRLAELRPNARVFLFEKSSHVLGKVKVSGGGRCNVTHACFDPRILCSYYPRGQKELLGPFHKFGPKHTIEWFEERGVELKTEADGRMFPVSDSSQTIVDTLLREADRNHVLLKKSLGLTGLEKKDNFWLLKLNNGTALPVNSVFIGCGSSNQIWELLGRLGLKTEQPVPSLFTFHIRDKALQSLSGLSLEKVEVRLEESKSGQEGPMLFTHWGLSGPAILKTSAWEARTVHDRSYQFRIRINYLPDMDKTDISEDLNQARQTEGRKLIHTHSIFTPIPKRAWQYLVERAGIGENSRWADLSNAQLKALQEELIGGLYEVSGKSTFKEEFVTCGGIAREEIDFRRFEAIRYPGLFFGGEVLDVDAVTGGFNFQHAWTSGWIAAGAMAQR